MASVIDVAAYVLERKGAMTAWKLQKLVYYGQAWSLVWDDCTLFPERIEAWANGPVCPTLYDYHRGQFWVYPGSIPGNIAQLTARQRETLDAVLEYYGDKTPQWLSDLTHLEAPWRDVRGDLPLGANCNREITPAAMAAYYESVPPDK